MWQEVAMAYFKVSMYLPAGTEGDNTEYSVPNWVPPECKSGTLLLHQIIQCGWSVLNSNKNI
jgi:hypothetical protein